MTQNTLMYLANVLVTLAKDEIEVEDFAQAIVKAGASKANNPAPATPVATTTTSSSGSSKNNKPSKSNKSKGKTTSKEVSLDLSKLGCVKTGDYLAIVDDNNKLVKTAIAKEIDNDLVIVSKWADKAGNEQKRTFKISHCLPVSKTNYKQLSKQLKNATKGDSADKDLVTAKSSETRLNERDYTLVWIAAADEKFGEKHDDLLDRASKSNSKKELAEIRKLISANHKDFKVSSKEAVEFFARHTKSATKESTKKSGKAKTENEVIASVANATKSNAANPTSKGSKKGGKK